MKKTFKIVLSLIFLFSAVQSFAQDKKEKKRYEHFKERNISKSYTASGNTLNIDNRFGEVKFTTWEKNEIKVDIHIEVSSNDKDYTDKMFGKIDVEDRQSGNNINFKTVLNKDKEKNTDCKNCNNTMSIDYDIHLPSATPLKVENSFGGIVIPDYTGVVSLISKFGSLTAGKLSHPEKIAVEFGKADLKSLGNIDLEFKYSTINIGSLTGNCKLKMSFCSYSKINLDNGLTSLTLNDSYSTVQLEPASNLAASYTVSTSFGSFVDKTGIGIKRTDTPSRYGPDSKRTFEGKSGSGNAKIDIKSSFGHIMIGKGTKDDMKEKRKVRT